MSFPDNFPLPLGYYPRNNINYYDLSVPFPEEEFDYLEDRPIKKLCVEVEKVVEMDVIPKETPVLSQTPVNISNVDTQTTEHLLRIRLLETTCELSKRKISELQANVGKLEFQRINDLNRIAELESQVAKNQKIIAERKVQTTKYADKLENQLWNNQKEIKELSAKESAHLDKIKALETTVAENQKPIEELKSQATNYIQQLLVEKESDADKIRSLEVERGFHVNRIKESESKIKELENVNAAKECKLNMNRRIAKDLESQNMQLKQNNSMLAKKCANYQQYIDQMELTPQYNLK